MKRLFWLAVGATVGIWAARRFSARAERFTPSGLAGQLSGQVGEVSTAVRAFTAEIRTGMRAREEEIRTALGIEHSDNGHRGFDAEAAARFADEQPAHRRDTH